MERVSIVGSGPTALYTLAALLDADEPLHVLIFERAEVSGTGGPYRAGDTDALLLANIASIEIPAVEESYADWLRAMPEERLGLFGVDKRDISERAFLPRVLLGAYFRDRMRVTVEHARAAGHRVEVYGETRVVDVAETAQGYNLSALHAGDLFAVTADHVVLATGHQWPDDQPKAGRFASPWPSAKLADLGGGRVGMLGTSLSGLDAAVAVASGCGAFSKSSDGTMTYSLHDGCEDLRISLMSRKGLLPEADFYCPIPYEPLQVCTPEALADLCQNGHDGLLDRFFDLMRREIILADPIYSEKIGLDELDADRFRAAYYKERLAADPFEYAERNLAEVRRDYFARRTSSYRYTILRLHEVAEPLVAQMSEADRRRFGDGIAQIFIDNYAAVPPETIARVLALREAGVLDIVRLGSDYRCDTEVEKGAVVQVDGDELVFDSLIDARGQKALVVEDLPFPTLRRQLVQDAKDGQRALELADDLSVRLPAGPVGRLYCAAVPFLLHRMPFVQGVTACHWLGQTIAASLKADLARNAAAPCRRSA